ncbi:hypothetical protein [Sphingosinicella sp. BN140058]|uniref:hypothetical protein n=1 Tax=Sphingosinicella sp. BN140058 TaxID=1892855 RepID=UPI001012F5ED|nr:hypothetical protein [Sphingosinicella sp. BN140058]QAY80383.1 hypothetical protein ETR14_27470 [Sphingosinicella sp. BN140058]
MSEAAAALDIVEGIILSGASAADLGRLAASCATASRKIVSVLDTGTLTPRAVAPAANKETVQIAQTQAQRLCRIRRRVRASLVDARDAPLHNRLVQQLATAPAGFTAAELAAKLTAENRCIGDALGDWLIAFGAEEAWAWPTFVTPEEVEHHLRQLARPRASPIHKRRRWMQPALWQLAPGKTPTKDPVLS